MATSALAAAPLLPLALYYMPPGEARDRGVRLAYLLVAAMVATGAPAALGLALSGACAPLAAYAAALGLATAVVYVVMYVPQIAATAAAHNGAGSLSYAFLTLHIVLGAGAAVQKADGTHERVLTWAPPLVANVMQLVLIVMSLYYDAQRRHRAHAAGEAAPLTGGAEEGKDEGQQGGKQQPPGYGAVDAPTDGTARAEKGDGGGEGDSDEEEPERFSRAWWIRYL